jgi:sporulation protein YlmC with PRC-barrel domain
MTLNTQLHLAAAVCCAFASFASAQTAAPAAKPKDAAQTFVLFPAGNVLGLEVTNDSQKDLGTIDDLLIDPRSGEIRYAVLEAGGFLGMGEDHRIVPWSLIQIVPDEKELGKGHARTQLTEDQVKAAPKCKSDECPDSGLDARIDAAFGKNDGWAYAGKGEAAFVRSSKLEGVVVKDAANKEIGRVDELVLAPMNSCVAYVVIDTNETAGRKTVALPWSRLEFASDREKKVTGTTTVELARFASAPEYDTKDWKRMSGTAWMNEISSYYTCDPFWKTTRFASARKATNQRP